MDPKTICLLNDSFPPLIDGVANAVKNYAEQILAEAGVDPEQKYIILLGEDECSIYPANDRDLDQPRS